MSIDSVHTQHRECLYSFLCVWGGGVWAVWREWTHFTSTLFKPSSSVLNFQLYCHAHYCSKFHPRLKYIAYKPSILPFVFKGIILKWKCLWLRNYVEAENCCCIWKNYTKFPCSCTNEKYVESLPPFRRPFHYEEHSRIWHKKFI
jgi:hypothetical protein